MGRIIDFQSYRRRKLAERQHDPKDRSKTLENKLILDRALRTPWDQVPESGFVAICFKCLGVDGAHVREHLEVCNPPPIQVIRGIKFRSYDRQAKYDGQCHSCGNRHYRTEMWLYIAESRDWRLRQR